MKNNAEEIWFTNNNNSKHIIRVSKLALLKLISEIWFRNFSDDEKKP